MMGGQSGSGHSAFDALAGGSTGSPWGSGSGAQSDLAQQAGIDDIGRSPGAGASTDGQSAGLFDSGDSDTQGDMGSDPDAFFGDDSDMGFGGDE
jgi:hypothetical protein